MTTPFKLKSGNSPVKFDFFKGKTKAAISKIKGKVKKVASQVKEAIQDPVAHGEKVMKGADILIAKAANPARAAYQDIKHYKETGKAPKLSEYEKRTKGTKGIDIIKEIHKKGLGYKINK